MSHHSTRSMFAHQTVGTIGVHQTAAAAWIGTTKLRTESQRNGCGRPHHQVLSLRQWLAAPKASRHCDRCTWPRNLHAEVPIFCDYFTFSTSVHTYNVRHKKLYLSQANTQFGQRSLKFKGGQLWNRLPQDFVNMSFGKFRNSLKIFLNCEPLQNDFSYNVRLKWKKLLHINIFSYELHYTVRMMLLNDVCFVLRVRCDPFVPFFSCRLF